jgi:hypothetical protein
MEEKFIVNTNKKERIKLESHIVAARWLCPAARGGAYAMLKVQTVFVMNNEFTGQLLIPENVKPNAQIWFEAKLPKHGITLESDPIPARPRIKVSKISWDRKEVYRGDEVKLTCQFISGVIDGQDAIFTIYEYNPNSYDFKILKLRSTIKNNKAEAVWLFGYDEDTAQIANHRDLKPIGKSYTNPQYYFIAGVDGVAIGEGRESGFLVFKDWIKMVIVDSENNPCKNLQGTITLPDGAKKDFTTDGDGKHSMDIAAPGKFDIALKDILKVDRIHDDTGKKLNIEPAPQDATAVSKTGISCLFKLPPYGFSM